MGCFCYLGKAAVWVCLICAFQPRATGSPQVALLQNIKAGGAGAVGLVGGPLPSSGGTGSSEAVNTSGLTEHRLRYRDECTREELRLNRAYMLNRSMWEQEIVFWEDRAPPPSECRQAFVTRNYAFTPQAKAFREWVGDAVPKRFQHLSVAYFYDSRVLWSEMCGDDGQSFCDVPEDAPRGFEFFKWRLRTEWPDFKRGAVPVTVCARWLTPEEADTLFDVVGEPRDCNMMWEAEQDAFRDFNWKRGWVPVDSDCLTMVNTVLDRYKSVKSRYDHLGIAENIQSAKPYSQHAQTPGAAAAGPQAEIGRRAAKTDEPSAVRHSDKLFED